MQHIKCQFLSPYLDFTWCSSEESAWQCRKHKRCRFYSGWRIFPWSRKWQPTPVFFFFFFLFNPYLFFPFIFIGWRPITLQKYTSNYCSSIPKNKWPNQKMGQITKQTFLQRRHTDGQQTHEKMLNITHCQRNANQSHNEVPPQYSCLENPMDRGAW